MNFSPEDFRFAGVIDNSLWDVSGWHGVCFFSPPKGTRHPPGIGFVFKDSAIGPRIFDGLKKKVGEADRFGVISLSILTGRHPIHGDGCSIYIGTSIEGIRKQDFEEANLVMEPHIHVTSTFIFHKVHLPDPSMEAFKTERAKYNGAYFISPSYIHAEAGQAVPMFEHLIGMRNIQFKDFRDVHPKDPEHSCLLA